MYLDFEVNGCPTSLPVENSSVQDAIARTLYNYYFKKLGTYKEVYPMLEKMISDFEFYDYTITKELVHVYEDDIKDVLREEVLKTIYD